jgi:hypothetical protein
MKYDIGKYNPCLDALAWYKEQPDSRTAWEKCHRGDWMLWIATKLGIDDRILTLAKGHCAATVLHLMKDKRSRDAVHAAINYGEGKINRAQLEKAADDAIDVIVAHIYRVPDVAAHAAVDAAAVITDTHRVAAATAFAAYWADYCDAICDATRDITCDDNIKRENLQKTANICRQYLTDAVFEKIGLAW